LLSGDSLLPEVSYILWRTVGTLNLFSFKVSLNSARDVGGRLFAISHWGLKGKSEIYRNKNFANRIPAGGGRYAAIAALTNIPATLFAVFLYEIFLTDSDRGMW